MTITELIKNLQKLQSQNPDAEIRFTLRDYSSSDTEPMNVGLDHVKLTSDAHGHGCFFRLFTTGKPK